MRLTEQIRSWFRPRAVTNAAGHGRRLVGATSISDGMNSLVLADGKTIRERALALYLNNPTIHNGVEAAVANAIGTGIRPCSKHKDASIRRELNEVFERWTEESDADGLTDFYGQQLTQCRSIWIAGESFSRIRFRRASDGLTVPLQVQTIEPAQLPETKTEGYSGSGQNRVIGGIEFDAIGRRVAYHFYRYHPGDAALARFNDAWETSRVPAEFVTHAFSPIQGNQVRGISRFMPLLTKAIDLDAFDDATLLRQRMSSNYVGFIQRLDPLAASSAGVTTSSAGTSPAEPGVAYMNVQAGSLIEGMPGEELKWSDPPQPGAAYQDFVSVQLRAIAAGLGITYEMLTGDLRNVTYLSGRLGRLEFVRRMEPFQFGVMVHQFIRPIVRAWVQQAVLAGVIDARDYKRQPEQYNAWEFRTPKWAWIDPAKDVAASIDAINAGLISRSQEIVGMGEDPEEVDQQRAIDQQREKALGIQAQVPNGSAIAAQQKREPAQPQVVQ